MTISYDKLSPVVLFAYNRPKHTLEVLEALEQNLESKESKLYVFCDGPRNDASKIDLEKIKQLREIIRKKCWFKEIEIIERQNNLGLDNSIVEGVSFVLKRHGKIIVLEDDNVPASHFLRFMNQALAKYETVENVYQVSGYFFPVTSEKKKSILLPIISSWGWGTWRNKWKIFKHDFEAVKILEGNRYLRSRFNLGTLEFYDYLIDRKSSIHWDVFFYLEVFKRNGLTVFPSKSLIRNIGFDGTGENCLENDNFDQILFDGIIPVIEEDQIDLEVYAEMAKYFESKRKIDRCIEVLEKLKKRQIPLYQKLIRFKN